MRDAANRSRSYERERKYDAAHRRRSKRLRRAQPFCLDCGTRVDLTADHLPSSVERLAANLPLRDEDYDVVCRPCNAKRGAAAGRGTDNRA